MLNEYFDRSAPTFERARVLKKGTRYTPIPVETLTVQIEKGRTRTIEVLGEFAARTELGSTIDVARSPGALGREWVQDKPFFLYLGQGGRTIQALIYTGVFALMAFVLYLLLRVVFSSGRRAVAVMPVALLISYVLFLVAP